MTPPAIPHSKPTIGRAEARAAAHALLSGSLAAAQRTAHFEKTLARSVRRLGAVATSSGTAALYVALRALGVRPGQTVIVPSFVCTALLHAVWAAGAEPLVCDVDDTCNLSLENTRANLTTRTAAIILPHLFGLPAPVEEFTRLGPPVIEDCAQSIGAHIGARPCGSFGAVSVFSFYATKMITTGEGGMLASDSHELLDRARDLIEYDKKHDAVRRFNLKSTDIAAAIGRVQLARLPAFVRRRRQLASLYHRELSGLDGIRLPRAPGSVYYRYVIQTEDPAALVSALASRRVAAARPVDPPLHRITGTASCPNAERAWARAVSLPIYPSLTLSQARQVAAAVREAVPQ